MRQIPLIAFNAFMELIRQPVFLLLFTLSVIMCLLLAATPYFGFGGTGIDVVNFDVKMVKDGVLTVMLLSGLFAAVICASTSLAKEISSGTAMVVLSKPVGRMHFLVGKFLGVAGALTVGTYLNLLAVLLASRMGYDAYGNPDIIGVSTILGFMLIAYVAAGFLNYFLSKPFVPTCVTLLTVMLTLGFLTVCAMDKQRAWWVMDSGEDMSAGFMDIWVFTDAAGTDSSGEALGAEEKDGFAAGVDWGMIQLSLLILFALWLLSALALLCSTRLSWLPTMSICSGVFLLGLMSDYLLGRTAEGGGMIHAGEYVIWTPPGNQAGTHTVFRLKPRGVRRLADMEFMVKMNVNGPATPEDKQLVDGVLTLDVRTEDGQIKIGYEEIKTKLDTLLKLRWNEPLERKMIQIGRQLLPGEFPGNSMELKLAGEIREKINSQSVELEQDETKKELLIEFRILDDQVTTKVVPGHLALWIMPEQGTLTKLDASVDEEVTVARGAVWAKTLYVLVPNWQLFWLSDSVGVEAEELSSRRAQEMAKVEAGKTGDRVDTTKSVKIRKRADVSYREGRVPWKYIFTAFVYVAVYIGVMLSGALMLFENRELA
ncbi:ABC transporter permease [Verrucomicrobia bacterium]|jgi:ABC-2 type transport system permease protein|nr:ABC transporter permease [Verrucomicrobiota bacterium]